ncbi:MAG: energy transducer TonB [Xanthomonadaceae bacterium]|nr:energy transducer TonB [Xanthomonadaceae bacterium]
MIILSLDPISYKKVVTEKQSPESTHSNTQTKPVLKPRPSSQAASSPDNSAQTAFGVATAKEEYFYELKKFFQRQLVYPAASASMREKGRVEIVFTVSREGVISDVLIHKPCNYSRLNQAAFDLVKNSTRFKAFPAQLRESSLRLAIPIDYEI